MAIEEKIKQLPDSPGVYLMKDARGEIIYIGKAKSLRKRVTSYLDNGLLGKTASLMLNVADIEYKICPTESMALVLEAALVRKFMPKYNVSLRDDKSFPLVKITNEEFPAIYITRKKENDGAQYFGPYTNVKLLRQALKVIRKYFPFRSCKALPNKACIYYRLKLSPAPCIGKISRQDYAKTIKDISLILSGSTEELIKNLTREMEEQSKHQMFEEAAAIRDKILALSSLRDEIYSSQNSLEELRDKLQLKKLPMRIEAFDVSNILGLQATASLVSFYNGVPDKDNYRRFRIKTVQGADDYKMLAEAVSRRYKRLKEENLALPDLILMDGGKGQLSAAESELKKLELDIPIISLAKREEEIFTPQSAKALRLKNNSAALLLVQHIRDESHRFALKYHQVLRKQKMYVG